MKSAPPSPRSSPGLLALVLLLSLPVLAQEQASLLHTPPTQAPADQPLLVEGVLTGTQRILRMVVRYRGPGEPYSEAAMELQYGDLYRGTIPAQSLVPPGVEYYVEGYSAGGERVPLFKSATRPARVSVAGDAPPTRPPLLATRPSSTRPSRPEPRPEPEPPVRPEPPARKPERKPEVRPEPEPAARVEPASSSRPERKPERKPAPPAHPESDDAMAALTAEVPVSGEPGARGSGSRSSHAPEPASSGSTPGETSGRSRMEEDLALYSAEDTLALATRHEETVKKVPAIASSFGREQIRALGARTVADVLDVVPGLSISRDVQGFYRTAIRGLRTDAEVLFLLNGHRLNNFYDGKALMNLPVENLERIEVIRGPGSAVYGAGAFLGVVNIVTQRSEGLIAAVSGGGFPGGDKDKGGLSPTMDGHVSGAHSVGGLKFFGDADLWYQSGYSAAIQKDALDADTINQKLREALDPAGYTQDQRYLLNLGAGFDYEVSPQGRLDVSLRLLAESRPALVGLFDTVGPDSRLGWLMLLGDVTYEHALSDRVRLRAKLSGDMQHTDRLFQLSPDNFSAGTDPSQFFPDGLLEQTQVTVHDWSLNADADISLFEGNRLSVGAVGELQVLGSYDYVTNYSLDNKRLATLTPPPGVVNLLNVANGDAARRLTLGIFAQDQWTVVEPLTLTLGVRLDATQLPTVNGNNEITGTHLVPSINPRVGLVFSATDSLVLKLLYGRAFRPPTLEELSETFPNTDYNQGRIVGNPALQPAVVNTIEAGADLIQAAGDARVRLRGNAFYESFDNPIITVDTTGTVVPVTNRELGVRVYGVEGEARLEASKRANAWVNASVFRAEDVAVPDGHQYLTDVPQARFNAGVSMPIGDYIDFDIVVRTGAERRNNTRSVLELIRRYSIPAYSLITAQVRTEPIAEHFELAFVVQNLFGTTVLDDVPRPDYMPGLLPREGVSAFLTLRAHN